MGGSLLICATLAMGAAPVPQLPPGEAPLPRLVKPDVSLIVSESLPSAGDFQRLRVLRIAFRNGKPMPTEVIFDCDENAIECRADGVIRANRYLVVRWGSVLDLREKTLINSEQEGDIIHSDDKRVTYRVEVKNREEGLFTFDFATQKLTRVGPLKRPLIPVSVPRSPDGVNAIDWRAGELFLHRDGQKPKSLGTGFKAAAAPGLRPDGVFTDFPLLWLDNDRFLTQREHGKLVTVNLDGKVTDAVTIKGLPGDPDAGLYLSRDPDGTIILHADSKLFKIDLAKKTATDASWRGLGHGFEIARKGDEDCRYLLRHNGKDIGLFVCWASRARAVPGYVVVPICEPNNPVHTLAVWSAATGKWTKLEVQWVGALLGWMKEELAQREAKP